MGNFAFLKFNPCCSVYPRTAARQIRSYGFSAENPSAPAIGAQYLNVSPIIETFFKTFSNSSTVIPASFAASSIVTRPFLTSLTNIRMKAEKRLNGGGFRFWRCCRSTRAFVRIFLQETRTNIANEVVYHGERLRLFWQRQYRICPL